MKKVLTVFAAAAMAALWRSQAKTLPLCRGDLGPLLVITVFDYAIPFILQPYIIIVIDNHSGHESSFAGMMVSFVPLITIVVSVPILGMLPTTRQLIGVIGGLAAMLYLIRGRDSPRRSDP